MALRRITIGLLSAFVAVAAVSAVGPRHMPLRQIRTPGASHLQVFGGRSPQQVASAAGSKFDAALARIARHSSPLRAGHEIEDLRALNPAARFGRATDGTPLVLIDAITRGDPLQLKSMLVDRGLRRPALYANDVSGWLPVAQLDDVSRHEQLYAVRAAMPYTRTGAAESQGDFVINAPSVRVDNALSGNGVEVGILSDSYNCYATYASNSIPADGHNGYASENGITTTATQDIASNDLPATVTVFEEKTSLCLNYGSPDELPDADEGRAMLQIVHDVAPGASLAFYPAIYGQADFANGIQTLATNGAKVIADDVGYFEEPFFQDGLISQAITAVKSQGVAYFTAAGNNGALAYDIPTDPTAVAVTPLSFPTTAAAGTPGAGEQLLNFDATGATIVPALSVTFPPMIPGEFVAIVVQWDQPFVTGAPDSVGATSRIDVCLIGASATSGTGGNIIGDDDLDPLTNHCTGANAAGHDPLQVIIVGNPASNTANSSAETYDIQVGLTDGTAAPNRIKLAVEGDGLQLTINSPFFTNSSPTIQGHSMSADAVSVGAALYFDTPACGTMPATLEYYSSFGGGPTLFDSTGTRLLTQQVRQKPDLVGPDGGANTFLGQILGAMASSKAGCVNGTQYPNFLGTSAAAPHVAAIAALMLEADPSLAPDDLAMKLQASTLPMSPTAPNYASGFGFVQADLAYSQIPALIPRAPMLSLSAGSVTVGGSDTLTWTSSNNQGCMASGAWSGAKASSGQLSISTTEAGSSTYTLSCTNATGTSQPASVTLTVNAAPAASSSGSHGGGSIDLAALFVLAAVWLAEMLRASRIRY